MPFYTPLRYPGGKRRLIPTIRSILEVNGLRDVQYVEPFAGGAAIGLALLFEEYAAAIHLNDLDRAVYAFWHAVLNDPERLCRRVESATISMRQWKRQRAIYAERNTADLDDLAFAALFLNRTNRSGILGGGVIGGKDQAGDWSLGVRFNKPDLVQRIRRISRYAGRIRLYHQDAGQFTKDLVPTLGANTFTFFDPPYIESGQNLYLNDYGLEDHRRLANLIVRLRRPWVVTYDYPAIRHGLFGSLRRLVYDLQYTAQARYTGREVMFICPSLDVPHHSNLAGPKMHVVPRLSRVRKSA